MLRLICCELIKSEFLKIFLCFISINNNEIGYIKLKKINNQNKTLLIVDEAYFKRKMALFGFGPETQFGLLHQQS